MAWVRPFLSPLFRFKIKKLTVIAAADHALSFEVLTASSDFITADAGCNPDLFWALKGGGRSTFGVILSITVKIFPEVPSASIILNINSTHTNDTSLFYKGVAAFHDLSNHWVDHGMFAYYELSTNRFHVQPLLGPNMTAERIQEVAKPMFDQLDAEGVPYSTSTKEFVTFFDLYTDIFEDEVAGVSILIGGWLFTKRNITEHAADIIAAYQTTLDSGTLIFGHIVGPGYGAPKVDNAIHPTWREGSSFSLTTYPVTGNAPLEEKAQAQNIVTNVVGEVLRRVLHRLYYKGLPGRIKDTWTRSGLPSDFADLVEEAQQANLRHWECVTKKKSETHPARTSDTMSQPKPSTSNSQPSKSSSSSHSRPSSTAQSQSASASCSTTTPAPKTTSLRATVLEPIVNQALHEINSNQLWTSSAASKPTSLLKKSSLPLFHLTPDTPSPTLASFLLITASTSPTSVLKPATSAPAFSNSRMVIRLQDTLAKIARSTYSNEA
jgi:hypothetical protein